MLGRELKAGAAVLAGFFILGAVAGGCYALVSAQSMKTNKYNTAQLTQNLQYAEVQAGRLQCVVLEDKAELYNLPSGLTGKVIERMSKGIRVDYLETVSSQDKDDSFAITTVELQF